MSFSVSGVLSSRDDRAAFLTKLQKQTQDAAVARAALAAFDCFPMNHDADVTVSGHLNPDATGFLQITIRGVARPVEAPVVEDAGTPPEPAPETSEPPPPEPAPAPEG